MARAAPCQTNTTEGRVGRRQGLSPLFSNVNIPTWYPASPCNHAVPERLRVEQMLIEDTALPEFANIIGVTTVIPINATTAATRGPAKLELTILGLYLPLIDSTPVKVSRYWFYETNNLSNILLAELKRLESRAYIQGP